MKRRVVKHGPSTLIISLPVKWVKQHGVTQGTELEVQDKGNTLCITTDTRKQNSGTEIDVTKLDRTSIVFYLRGLYRKGYSEIRVRFLKPSTTYFATGKEVPIISIIHDEVNRMIGMEIIEERGNYCVIKEITESSEREFDGIFRKVFFQLQGAFEDVIAGLEKNDLTALSTVQEKHDTITKFVSYCIRLINQDKVNKPESASQLYHILVSVDLMTDILKCFCRDVSATGHKFRKENIKLLQEMHNLVDIYSKLQFKFDPALMLDFQSARNATKKKLQKNLMDGSGDMVFINYISSMMDVMRMMTEATLSCMHGEAGR